MQMFKCLLSCMILGTNLLANSALYSNSPNGVVRKVTQAEILNAMLLEEGYDPTATTNVARFQAAVVLRLARDAHKIHPYGPPLLIGHVEWFEAFLRRTALSQAQAPTFARLAFQHRQDQLVDYRYDRVISKVEKGAPPQLALNVKVMWPDTARLPAKYSFEDTLSTPKLRVTNHRVITYRLLDFGDMIVYDCIRGLTGRPTSGILGFLFRVIGEGHVVQSKIITSKDGLQIAYTAAKKGPFAVNTIVTVRPDGHMEKGLPNNRKDLLEIEARLKRRFKIKYIPYINLK